VLLLLHLLVSRMLGFYSQALSAQTFQILDEAAAVLSALHAQHIPLALLLPAQSGKLVKSCLQDTKLLSQFAAVVSRISS
jgi:hypothetical protein